jgi:hypothetical protein
MRIKDRVGNKEAFDLEDERFWSRVVDILMTGLRAVDDKGHSEWIRFRIEPALLNELSAVIELLPDGFVNKKGPLNRVIWKIGLLTILKVLRGQYKKDISEVEEILKKTVLIEKELNKLELDKQFRALKAKTRRLIVDEEGRAEIIDMLDKLKSKVAE